MTPEDLNLLVVAGLLVETGPGEYRIARGAECLLRKTHVAEPTAENRPGWSYDAEADRGNNQPKLRLIRGGKGTR